MSRMFLAAFGCTSVLAFLVQAQIVEAQQAIWLDQPLAFWNGPDFPVPTAPAPPGAPPPRCTSYERMPISNGPARSIDFDATGSPMRNEEAQVAAAGWKLENYWPTRRKGDLAVVLATSTYDGMCRPWRFNGFMFYRRRFAGTLSPVNMNSREDGVLAQDLSLPSDHEVDAEYLRYAQEDPLCCPSRGRTMVMFGRHGSTSAPLMVPEKASTVSSGRHRDGWLGLQLPQILVLALTGILLAGAGGGMLVWRGRAKRGAS